MLTEGRERPVGVAAVGQTEELVDVLEGEDVAVEEHHARIVGEGVHDQLDEVAHALRVRVERHASPPEHALVVRRHVVGRNGRHGAPHAHAEGRGLRAHLAGGLAWVAEQHARRGSADIAQ